MSVRKRNWTTAKGVEKTAWICDYTDQQGKRRMRTFAQKKAADAFEAQAKVEVRDGTHTPASASITVAEAAEGWLRKADEDELERSTRAQYRQHVELHIVPLIGRTKLSALTVAAVRDFESRLRTEGRPAIERKRGRPETPRPPRSEAMVRAVLASLSSILSDAIELGRVHRNVVRDLRSGRKPGKARRAEGRRKGKLKVEVDIPSREEVKGIIDHVKGRWRPLILTAIFTGLRASELRGLRWKNVDLDAAVLHVRERADRYNEIGSPKSQAGERSVPLTPMLANTLREWKLQTGGQGLVFGNGKGKVELHGNIAARGLIPAQVAAGVTKTVENEQGISRITGKYGMHALRHFYASWCINPTARGGLELSPKVVQARMGHSSIVMTLDTYGHLFPEADDSAALAEAEAALLA